MVAEPALIATHSGLRGRPGEGLSPDRVRAAAAAFVLLLREAGLPAAVGLARDTRPSGAGLSLEVANAAAVAGAEVADFGVVSTPAAKLAARRRGLGGVIVVTGSHLQPDWNGIKLAAAPDYVPVDVRSLPEQPPAGARARRGAVRPAPGAAAEHAEAVCASVDRDALARAGLRVAIAGGAGPAPRIALGALGCEVGENAPAVTLRLDADGDRLHLGDERGVPLDEEATLALAVVARGAETVVKGADTSAMVDVLAHRRGGSVQVVPPGELHLVRALAASGADLAGEGNGGVIVPEVGLARDGLAAAAAVLELIVTSGAALSEHAAALPRFARRRSSLPSRGRGVTGALEGAAERLGGELGRPEAGLRVERGSGAWALLRESATEPVLRVTVEAATEEEAAELHAEVLGALDATA